jgi:hypothetical protein
VKKKQPAKKKQAVRKKQVRTRRNSEIFSKDKKRSFELTDEAINSMRRKPLADRKLLRFLLSTDEADMPSSSDVRLLAVEALAFRGYTIFDRAK